MGGRRGEHGEGLSPSPAQVGSGLLRGERVRVLHRGGRAGLGTAYVAGFSWALEHGYARVAQMDADGSHAPEQLPLLLQAAADADVVLGSRYVVGGRTQEWPRHRRALSQLGNLYARRALGTDLRDMTGGYRVFHRHVLAELPLAEVASQGYCFQVDLAWRACRGGYRIREVPITFTERRLGRSKMNGAIVREALWRITDWGLSERRRRWLSGRRPHPTQRGHHALPPVPTKSPSWDGCARSPTPTAVTRLPPRWCASTTPTSPVRSP